MRALWRTGLFLMVLGALPFVVVEALIRLGHVLDCELNMARVQPCVVFGVDIGGVLTYLGVMGWFMLVSWPLLLAGLALWAVAGLIALVRWARRAR